VSQRIDKGKPGRRERGLMQSIWVSQGTSKNNSEKGIRDLWALLTSDTRSIHLWAVLWLPWVIILGVKSGYQVKLVMNVTKTSGLQTIEYDACQFLPCGNLENQREK
jgi:hypothetical protein